MRKLPMHLQMTRPKLLPKQQQVQGKHSRRKITLKFFTALADRANGSGKVEQDIIDAYMKENPNVKIEVEALQDEPYKSKIKVYASSNQLPDIIQAWGQPSFLSPLLDNDLLLELNSADFEGNQFVSGSMDGFSKDGKLYGLPRGADYMVMYYNKKYSLTTASRFQKPQMICLPPSKHFVPRKLTRSL